MAIKTSAVMPVDLTTELRAELIDALTKAFVSPRSMNAGIYGQSGFKLDERLNLDVGKRTFAEDAVRYAEDNNWLETLVRAALKAEPLAKPLQSVANELDLGSLPEPRQQPLPPAAPDDPALQEVIVRRRPPMPMNDFMDRLRLISRAVCWVGLRQGPIADGQFGSGFLVGPDLLLTNWHVVRRIASGGVEREAVTCRFDYLHAGDGQHGPEAGLSEGWLLDHAEPAASDEEVGGDKPTADQLDYALVRLDRAIGSDADRPWLRVAADPPPMMAKDLAFVVQHPAKAGGKQEGAQQIAQGIVEGFEAEGRRIRYDVGTTSGSSGSPVFTFDLQLSALHQGTEPIRDTKGELVARARTYNRGIPLRPIIKRLAANPALPRCWS